jgi:DeoR/GlpR family transcriptional regulator of sugar metabolism
VKDDHGFQRKGKTMTANAQQNKPIGIESAERLDEIRMPRGLYIRKKMSDQHDVKRLIAIHIAENYVENFDAVLLDAGSTAEMIAEELFARRQFLSLLTNNMGAYAAYTRAREIVAEVETATEGETGELPPNQGNELLITGGRYVDVYEALLGEGALSSIREFHPNIIILGTSGLRCEEGIFCHGAEESAVKRLLWTKPTDIRLIATDWTKVGKRDAHSFGPVEQLCVNAKQAVIVTCEPPKQAYDEEPDRVREFQNQLKKIETHNIVVVKVEIPSELSEKTEGDQSG